MDFSEGSALEIVERLCSAYGVTTQKALAECLGVPEANVSNWVQRDSVLGSAIVKCALDTGCNLNWLASGRFANTNLNEAFDSIKGAALYKEITSNGGRPILRRIMDAYGFTLQKQLCDLLGISSGTVSTWIRRNYFPGEVVVACALETGVSLKWLALGRGDLKNYSQQHGAVLSISKRIVENGIFKNGENFNIDAKLLKSVNITPEYIVINNFSWVVDVSGNEFVNGGWVINIDGKYDYYDVSLLPAGN